MSGSAATAASAAGAPSAPAPLAVLVVDDEATIRNLLSLVVGRAGAKAFVAETAAAARALLTERRYAVALLDKNLPDGTGVELLAEIKRETPTTECFLITGYASTESAIEAVRLGAFDYIVKPFDVSTVAHRLGLALDRTRLALELEGAQQALARESAALRAAREELRRAYLETVARLARLAEYADEQAPAHVSRLARYTAILARSPRVGAHPEWIEDLACAVALHDVGNVAVPATILRKAGPLTMDERAALRAHVDAGARLLEGATSDVLALAREIVLAHHERWDGSGYPAGLAGEAIPLSGRIVAIADAWDAMTSDRVYRRAPGPAFAETELRAQAAKMFDPALVEAFLAERDKLAAVLATPPE